MNHITPNKMPFTKISTGNIFTIFTHWFTIMLFSITPNPFLEKILSGREAEQLAASATQFTGAEIVSVVSRHSLVH